MMTASTEKIELIVSDDDHAVAYVKLPAHPGVGTYEAVVRSIPLSSLMKLEGGTELHLDIDDHGRLIGIEVLL